MAPQLPKRVVRMREGLRVGIRCGLGAAYALISVQEQKVWNGWGVGAGA